MVSPFEQAANDLIQRFQPRCTGFMFSPRKPFGVVHDELGVPLLNLGVAGALYLMAVAEEATDKDVARVLPHPADHQEFWRWISGFQHTFDQTLPELAEMRSLKRLDEDRNAELYRRFGLPVEGVR